MSREAAPLPGKRPRTRRLSAAAALLLLTGVLIAVLSGTASAALPKPTVTLTGTGSPIVGQTYTLTVAVTNMSIPGELATLERNTGLIYQSTGQSALLDGSSKATFTITPTSTSTQKYRVTLKATTTHQAGTSNTLSVAAKLPTPTVTVTKSNPAPSYVNEDQTLTVSVSAPNAAGESVKLQKFSGLSWSTVSSQNLDTNSQATWTVRPTAAGTTKYQATIAKTAAHNAATSATYSLVTVTKPPADCGGTTIAKPGGGTWTCKYEDEFDGNALSSDWFAQQSKYTHKHPGEPTNPSCIMDNQAAGPDQTIKVSGGYLQLFAKVLDQPVDCGDGTSSRLVSGEVMHLNSYSQTYGRYEVMAKLPDYATKGLQETFWLWPKNTGDQDGREIDFSEFYSGYPNNDLPYFHYYDGTSEGGSTAFCPINYGQFNRYTFEWSPGNLKTYINGVLCINDNYQAANQPTGSPAPFNVPFFLDLRQAFGVNQGFDNLFPVPGAGTQTYSTQIDYVYIWQ
ncbi:family 16 glycosylhydrolase [Nocardioides marmorisolisilvae]|uniref:Glycosyl hydrolase family protein n=1 Tax=Nocardioides marmorisolisilvae TaxID=1542737 RepID=A0A3N0DPQ5_9ACTN|nr:family 16 glycosylhydrolase [Nocardioides marmorisolisilvae]RNL77426.1 glycosyl hydrolase family protein [Nocardioides marmorisolisilvae]